MKYAVWQFAVTHEGRCEHHTDRIRRQHRFAARDAGQSTGPGREPQIWSAARSRARRALAAVAVQIPPATKDHQNTATNSTSPESS